MKIFKKILVPVDFSEFSLSSDEYARSLAIIYDATIYLVYVVDNDPVLAVHTMDLNTQTVLQEMHDTAKKRLQEVISERFNTMRYIVPIVLRGEPAKEIVKFARDEGVDIIIMATHGRTGLAHVLMGSVAEKVVRHSSVPVLTVKPAPISEKLLDPKDIEEQLHMVWE